MLDFVPMALLKKVQFFFVYTTAIFPGFYDSDVKYLFKAPIEGGGGQYYGKWST